MKSKRKNRIISIMLAFTFLCATTISPVMASDGSTNRSHPESNATQALNLINELVSLSLRQEIYEIQILNKQNEDASIFADDFFSESKTLEAIATIESKISEIERQMEAIGVLTLNSNDDMMSFFGVDSEGLDSTLNSNLPPWPNPGSNANIQFYGIFDRASNGQQIWLLIASPINNRPHSANQRVIRTGASGNLLRDGARTLMGIYAERIFGNWWDSLPYIRWLPWELVPGLVSQTTQAQLPQFEAEMITRTVTQFVYFRNSFGQPVYYGSTNVVHVGLSQRYLDTRGAVSVWRASSPIIEMVPAINYFDFGRLIVNQNLTGFNIRVQHSFVGTVTHRAIGNTVLTIRPPGFTLPIHATR